MNTISKQLGYPSDQAEVPLSARLRRASPSRAVEIVSEEGLFRSVDELDGLKADMAFIEANTRVKSAGRVRRPHISALARYWWGQGLTQTSIDNRLKSLDRFFELMGRPQLIAEYCEHRDYMNELIDNLTSGRWREESELPQS